jgi:hypothetical protein
MDVEDHIFISDREKGIAIAVEQCFPQALHLHCCQHIADNLQQRFGNKVRPLFWAIAYTKSRATFAEKMELLWVENKDAHAYLQAIDKKLWSRAYQPYPKYGHNTSNIIESLNGAFSDIRCQPPIRMMDSIYSYCMKLIYDRAEKPQVSLHLADVPWAKYLARLKDSRRYNVFPSGHGIFQVEIPDTGIRNIVKLAERLCDCRDFYEYQGPCTHAIAAIQRQGDDPLAFFLNQYTTDYFRRTYSYPIIPISINDLATSEVNPPTIRKQAGRPRTKRIRKGQWSRKQKQCSNCLDWGHSKRTCRGQPASSGRRERARDWLAAQVENACSNGASDNDDGSASDSNDSTEEEIIVELADLFSELDESVTLEEDVLDQDELVIQPLAIIRRSSRGKK